ncbi:MAG: 2-octaprenyl-6-methoxyphenyl hydroxylase [Alphaproteobacteria bacterium]|nr:2-octaprenyl-6-methoxyphenyl hydroxylase [Alphaproteobacteria bacterium]
MRHTHDILIAGGGLVGMATAVALASGGLRVAVVERTPPPSQLAEGFDGRVSAISLGSQKLFAQLGVWERIAALAEPILDIRVSDADSPIFLHYDHREVGDEPFGWIVENRHTRAALFERAKDFANLELLTPASITGIETTSQSAIVTLADGRTLSAPLLIGADGKHSRIRDWAGIKAHTHPYHQTAIVCTIAHTEPHHGLALEKFLPIGPFAVLPMQNNQSSLVWTESHERAEMLISLPDDAFIEEITRRVGTQLGEISLVGGRFKYPLTLVHAESYISQRVALVGDAAHGIHPIAGQGVNLGFRDVAALAEVLVDAKRLGLDIGAQPTLQAYTRWRSFDAMAMVATTDILNRLFSNNVFPLNAARNLGLGLVGKLPGVKRFFMRHAMGMEGDLPRLMRGKRL